MLMSTDPPVLEWFSGVEQRRYEDGLKVTEAAPLAKYILYGTCHERVVYSI